jgi:hypothetical protein
MAVGAAAGGAIPVWCRAARGRSAAERELDDVVAVEVPGGTGRVGYSMAIFANDLVVPGRRRIEVTLMSAYAAGGGLGVAGQIEGRRGRVALAVALNALGRERRVGWRPCVFSRCAAVAGGWVILTEVTGGEDDQQDCRYCEGLHRTLLDPAERSGNTLVGM